MAKKKQTKDISINWREVALNASVTFLQGFAAAFLALDGEITTKALIGCLAAALSFVYNTSLKPLARDWQNKK